MTELYKRVEEVEHSIQELSNRHRDLVEFTVTGGETKMETLIEQAEKEAQEQIKRHETHLIKIQNRHEQSMFWSTQRIQKIMKDMESVASKVSKVFNSFM